MSRSCASYVLATAGHVDHGKSALVHALTGTDPDRLPEEKARGITIDLGFAELKLSAPDRDYEIGLVDVPGHEDFVKNMVAGVGAVDAALLVVAADDGWMPQTQEHFDILTYLGVRRGVVALSKVDLADDPAAAVERVRTHLRGTPWADADIVPTSVRDGRGLAELKTALIALLASTPMPPDRGRPRLAVDRVFSGRGVGTIVTGTLTGGSIQRGATVTLQPAGVVSRVRTVQTYHRTVDVAPPGCRVALNLPDLTSVRRGEVVTVPGVGVGTTTLDVLIERTANTEAPPLRDGVRIRVHHGTAAVVARVRLQGVKTLLPGQRSIARLTLTQPLHVMIGDRFVLRSDSELHTLGGGFVLDAAPPRGRRRLRQAAMLRTRAAAPDDLGLFIHSQLLRDGFADPTQLRALFDVTSTEFDAAVLTLQHQHVLAAAGPLLADLSTWTATTVDAAAAIDAFHAAQPEQQGLAVAALRMTLQRTLAFSGLAAFTDDVAAALVATLCGQGFSRTGAVLHRTAHRPRLPAHLRAAGDSVLRQLIERQLDPPGRKSLCTTDAAAQAMRFLISTGEVIDLGGDVVVSAHAYTEAARRVRDYLASGMPATVSELKTLLGSNRRVMVPLLERFDRERVTVRRGDVRALPS